MKFNDNDLLHFDNLVKILDHASYDNLKGADIIAFYRTFEWAAMLKELATKEVAEAKALQSAKIKETQEVKSPIKDLNVKKIPKKRKTSKKEDK